MTYTYSVHPEDKELLQPVTIIRPRAIIKWPGIAEFFTRNRYVKSGLTKLEGRCWVGGSTVRRKEHIVDIAKVELSFDNGDSWEETTITQQRTSPWGWNKWEYDWDATPGVHTIIVRATATDGVVQPTWPGPEMFDYRSMGTIAAQRITVHVVNELYVGLESIQSQEPTRDPKPADRKIY